MRMPSVSAERLRQEKLMPVDRERNQVRCHDFQELADSYLSDELLVETNHDVIRHLETCADCRRELAARRNLRDKLRSGFESAPDLQMRKEFEARLTTQLRDVALSRTRTSVGKYVAIAPPRGMWPQWGFTACHNAERRKLP